MPPQTDTGWILEYLVFTMNEEEQAARARFETVFALTQTEKDTLRAVAAKRSDGERAARGRATAAIASALNADAEQGLRLLAGSRYEAMVTWLREWYADNMAMRTQQQINLVNTQKRATQRPNPLARLLGARVAASSYSSLMVYQTQFGSSGWDGALPDYALKYATLGWCCVPSPPYNTPQYPSPYWFGATYNGVTFSQIYTKDVGPWNEDDNHWDFGPYSQAINPRRCNPYPGYQNDGIPEAQLAKNSGFNGGQSCVLSQTGGSQAVLNIAGVDLNPDIAAAFGLCRLRCNSWMTVTYTRNP